MKWPCRVIASVLITLATGGVVPELGAHAGDFLATASDAGTIGSPNDRSSVALAPDTGRERWASVKRVERRATTPSAALPGPFGTSNSFGPAALFAAPSPTLVSVSRSTTRGRAPPA